MVIRRYLSGGAILLALAGGLCAEEALPIKGLRIPLSHWPDGSVKMEFSAERARAPEAGDVDAEVAVVKFFTEGGVLETRLEAETCRFDRAAGVVHSESAVRLDRADIEITGVGMDMKPAEEKVRLLSRVRVVLKGSGGLGKMLPERTK